MGDAAEDARDTEEMWDDLRYSHKIKTCDDDCPFCSPEFKSLWAFQHRPKDKV